MLAERHKSMTTPDSEDWSVIISHGTIHIVAFREEKHPNMVEARDAWLLSKAACLGVA
jgi:hypothetical protein